MKQFCSLSEAIRAGVALRPQCEGFFEETREGYVGSCALGAAYEAMSGRIAFGLKDQAAVYDALEKAFPYMLGDKMWCPQTACDSPREKLKSIIIHLNDEHGWTRERIADFVEQYEEKIGFVHVVESEQERSSSQVVAVGV